jgi:hypothetical protein
MVAWHSAASDRSDGWCYRKADCEVSVTKVEIGQELPITNDGHV